MCVSQVRDSVSDLERHPVGALRETVPHRCGLSQLVCSLFFSKNVNPSRRCEPCRVIADGQREDRPVRARDPAPAPTAAGGVRHVVSLRDLHFHVLFVMLYEHVVVPTLVCL